MMSSESVTQDATALANAQTVPQDTPHNLETEQLPRLERKTAGVNAAVHLLQTMRKIDPEFPIQYALCLTEIARRDNLSVTELAQRTNISLSTVSRIITALSNHKGRYGSMIDVRLSRREARRKELSLTPLGHDFIANLTQAYEIHVPKP